jgi:hypothetical protein
MPLPCESIGRRLLPLLRAYIAKELIEKYGLKQIEIAKKLGTTQAARIIRDNIKAKVLHNKILYL